MQTRTSFAIWRATTLVNKTHVAYDCTAHQTMALLPTMHCFMRTNLGTYSIHVAVFSKWSGYKKCIYSNNKINKEYTVLLEKLSDYPRAGTLQPACFQA